MKNIKFLALFVISIFVFFLHFSALEDEEAPTLSSVYLSNYVLNPGESVTVYVQGNDNLTGIAVIDVEARLKSDNSKNFGLVGNVTPSNSFSYTKIVPENVQPGEYEIYAVQVWDGANNLRTYYLGEEDFPFDRVDITVNDNGKDNVAPVLSNFRITPQVTTYPSNFTISVDATDDKSAITQVTFYYEINGKLYDYTLSHVSGNTYSAFVSINENAVYSDAKFVTAYVYDSAGNKSKYDTDVSRDPFRDYNEIILSQNLDVVFSNKINDTEYPVLHKCFYDSNKVSAPGTARIYCSITDDTGVGDVKIYFQGEDQNGEGIDSLVLLTRYDNSKKQAVATYTFGQYIPNSIFYIDRVEITDTSGKTITYSIYDDGNPNMEKVTMTLVQSVVSDITTSTVNNDYVEKIESLENGKSITIDTTSDSILKADAFSAIKGKDVNMIVINDGIQWIFNGLNIINDVKDINTKINIYKIFECNNGEYEGMFSEGTDAIVIEFASNGLLPGKSLIKIKADYSLRDYIGDSGLYVYHIEDSSDGLESIAKQISLSEDGYYKFYITHNSKYIISKKAASKSNVVKDSILELGNEALIDTSVILDDKEENIEVDEINKIDVKNNKSFKSLYIIIPSCVLLIILFIILVIINRNKINNLFLKFRKKS